MGADRLSDFFEMVRLNTPIGVSPSALRNQLSQMEKHLPVFQTLCEEQAGNSPRKAVVAMDETFFGSFMILVLMDLQSGYLLLEDIAEDRKFDTWHKKVTPRLESLGIEVTHAISDRAKALIKLAITGFECESGADVFHAQQDVSRWLGSSIKRKVTSLEKEYSVEKSNDKQQDEATTKEVASEQDTLKKPWEAASDIQKNYHANLRGVAEDIHPFNLNDQKINSSEQVEEALEQRIQQFESLAKEQEIADKKKTAQKFRNQIKALSSTVTVWWHWVNSLLYELELETEKHDWLTQTLLPMIHWHHQLNKTQNKETKVKYQVAWEQASHKLSKHSLTHKISNSELEQWVEWSQWMVRQFHRSSSAVEGRNGCLSQMYHNGRGLTENRLKALTVIHNYGIKRHDGTTAAMRLFNTELPDLFSWLLDEMGALPLPRKSRGKVIANPMKLLSVPL